MKKKILSCLSLFVVLVTSAAYPAAWAGEETAGDYMSEIGTKFGRGLFNVVSSPAEIPCRMTSEIKSKGAAEGTFTGLGKGVGFMLWRILVGVDEVGTFMIPMEATLPTVCTEAKPAA